MKSKRRFSWFRLLLVGMVAYFGYISYQQQMNLNEIYQEQESVGTRLAEAQQVNDALHAEKDKLLDREYIEKVAREELGLVKPGEMPYISSKKN